jgi:hypothetical protein
VGDGTETEDVQTLRADSAPTVQREADGEAEEEAPAEGVQTLRADTAPTVQREAAGEDEEPAEGVQTLRADGPATDVQRAEAGPEEREDEDVTAQGLFVQREGDEATEDEEPAAG